MGLKSGSRDAGLDESGGDGERGEPDGTGRQAGEMGRAGDEARTDRSEAKGRAETRSDTDASDDGATSERPSMDAIPYKLRRAKVNEGREQVPYFLREEVIDAEGDLQDALEELLGESVYKSDYREASMVVAQRNPELVAEVLREWGYDLDRV